MRDCLNILLTRRRVGMITLGLLLCIIGSVTVQPVQGASIQDFSCKYSVFLHEIGDEVIADAYVECNEDVLLYKFGLTLENKDGSAQKLILYRNFMTQKDTRHPLNMSLPAEPGDTFMGSVYVMFDFWGRDERPLQRCYTIGEDYVDC
ncbi:MAG: hypothetical protein AAGF95_07915 [Chloroflexota bacterium]